MSSALLTWLLNGPTALRRLAALFMLVTATALACLIIWLPSQLVKAKHGNLMDQRQRLGKLQQTLAASAQLSLPATEAAPQVFLEGSGEGSIQASLQRRLTALMRDKRQNLTSVGPAQKFNAKGVSYFGIVANVSGNHQELSRLVFELETSKPPLLIRSARLSARQALNDVSKTTEQIINAQLEIFGAIDPKEVE